MKFTKCTVIPKLKFTKCTGIPKLMSINNCNLPRWRIPKMKFSPNWNQYQMMSTQRWEFTPNYEVHPAVGELHLVDFNLMNIICKWNSKWVEFKMGRIQNGWPSIWEFHTGNNWSVNKHYRGICYWALLICCDLLGLFASLLASHLLTGWFGFV